MNDGIIRVLLVEDDKADYLIMRDLLSQVYGQDLDLEWAPSYETGLKRMQLGTYDACLLDFGLGELNGLDFIDELIKNGCSHVPVIFLTRHSDFFRVDARAMKTITLDFLVKEQINTALLERSICYAIERKRIEEELKTYVIKLMNNNRELAKTLRQLQVTKEELSLQNRELMESEKARVAEHQRYLDLFDNAPDGYVVTDSGGTITEANLTAGTLLGISREKLVGRPLASFVVGEDLTLFADQIGRLDRLPSLRDWETRLKPHEGASFHAAIAVTKVVSPVTGNVFLRWLLRDISANKRAAKAIRDSEQKLRSLSSQLLTAQEEERKRISRELHDSIGSSLSTIKFCLENVLADMDRGPIKPESLKSVIGLTQSTIDESRRIMTDLRPSILDDLGIVTTIRWFCRRFQEIYTGILVEEAVDIQEHEVPEPLKIVIFRVMQEAMNNIAKYSKAQRVGIALAKTRNGIELVLRDDGKGFSLDTEFSRNDRTKGFGLTTMKERTELSGGSFALQSSVGAGTIIRASWTCS